MSEAAAEPGLARLLTDERLTRRAAAGDERAFAGIYRRYHQPLYRFCLALVGNPEDAQEALQNTMIKVLRALPGEEREIELKPWLYRIAHNESIDLLRRRRETRQLDVEQIAPGYGLADDAETRERLRRLVADLKELPERQREALVMRELGGLDFEEIGRALATSGAVARQTLYEARQSLRQMDEGREMSCAAVTKALSDGDGRVTRRRDVRAHLRACAGCRAFGEEIEGRQRDLAALAPLPAVAAAGMLQGLLGGSHGVAGGGGLAATLGGGAAKTIGASAAAKGVATVAVVAAIGVTAADRTGAIHLGLPGEPDAKQASATPEPGPAAGAGAGAAAGGEAAAGPAQAKTRSAAGAPSQGAVNAAAGQPQSHAQGEGSVNAKGWGPGVEHPSGKGHEQQPSPAASKGEETAAAHAPSPQAHEPSGAAGGDGKAAAPAKPPQAETHPQSAPGESPKGPPSEPPSAAPEPGAQPPNPEVEHPTPEAHPGAGSEPEKGRGGETGKGAS